MAVGCGLFAWAAVENLSLPVAIIVLSAFFGLLYGALEGRFELHGRLIAKLFGHEPNSDN